MHNTEASAARASSTPRDRRLWLGVAALVLLFQSAFFAWFPRLGSPNELTRVYLAGAVVEDGSVEIDAQISRHGPIFDIAVREVDGRLRHYCDKAPGVSLIAVPALYVYERLSAAPTLAGKVRLIRLVASTLPTLLLMFLFARLSVRHGIDAQLSAQLALFYGLGSVATAYASLAFGHQLSAVLLFSVFALTGELPAPDAAEPRLGSAAAIGAAAAAAVVVEYQNSLLLLPLAVFFVLRVGFAPRALAAAATGALPFAALLLVYHQLAFGSPFATGYSFLASSFKEVHAKGMLGVGLPSLSHAYLSFLAPSKGLFFFAPWLALSVPGALLAWRSGRDDLRVAAAFALLYALFVSALIYPVGGWTMSQRHLVPSVPFMLILVALAVRRYGRAGHVLLFGLGLPALLMCGVSSVVWPHYQEQLVNPFWQLGWPLFEAGFVAPTPLSAVISSRVVACGLLGLGALLALLELARRPGTPQQRGAAVFCGLGLAAALLWLGSLPGRAQDVAGDLRFAEDMYRDVGE